MADKKQLKKLPGFSIGVRENAALRDVVLAQPICPKSQIRGRMIDGHYEAPEIGPGDENCMLAGGEWWKDCEARGHDPYFRDTSRTVTRPIYERDEEGDLVLVREKKVRLEGRELNVTSISASMVHNSGQGVRFKKRHYGLKSLADMGYEEVCQFRACQRSIRIKNPRYGDYCSMEHLELAAAESEAVVLTRADFQVPGVAEQTTQKVARRRRNQLRGAVEGYNVDVVDG